MTDTLTLTGEYAYANDFEVRLRALTDLTGVENVGVVIWEKVWLENSLSQ